MRAACYFNILIGIWHIRHFFFTFILPSHHINLRDQPFGKCSYFGAENWHFWQHNFCKSLLDVREFYFHLFVNWTTSAFASFRLTQNHLQKCFFPSGKVLFFWGHPRCFGLLDKLQHNIKISIKTARVSRLSFFVTMI